MNPFDILEIRPGVSAAEIKAAYHRLAKMWHPDHFTGAQKEEAEGKFRDISEAFNILKDPERRVWAEEEFRDTSSQVAPEAPIPARTTQEPRPLERTAEDWFQESMKAFKELDTDRAEGLVQFAIRQDPNKADYHLFLAKLLETRGADRRVIIKAYEAALKLNPKDVENSLRLAEHFQAIGMQARASALILKVREIAPNHKLLRKYGMGASEASTSKIKSKALGIKDLGTIGEQAKALFNKILRRG